MTMSGMGDRPGTLHSNYAGATLAVGERVMTADGNELGKIKEITGACFKVDASMQPDYWLGNDCIADATANEVRLNIPKDRVGDMKMDGPEHSGIHRHMT